MPPTDRLLTRMARGVKAISNAPHPQYRDTIGLGYGSGIGDRFYSGRLPDDWHLQRERVGDGSMSGVVENTLAVKSRAWTEIAPQVGIRNADDPEAPPEPDPDHPLNELLQEPNEAMGWRDLGDYLIAALDLSGTGFLAKVGTETQVTSLWPLYPEAVEPVSRGGDFLSYWRYQIEGQTTDLEPADVVVVRNRLRRDDHRLGMASIAPVLREIATDEEAARFSSTILHNLGVPGVVLTARDQYNPPSQEEATGTLRSWRDRFGGQRRGDPWIQSDYDISVVSFSPQQMDLRTLRQIPEERVTSALGVPAILAGMGAGLDRATYSNAAELRAFFTEQTLIPLWEAVAETLTRQLLPLEDRVAGRLVYFDTTRVRALQEDRNTEADRIVTLVDGAILTVDEGRELLGYDALPEVVDVNEGVGTAFVEGDAGQVDLSEEDSEPLPQAADAWTIAVIKADTFSDAAWEDRYEDTIGDVLAGWASAFTTEIGLDTEPDSILLAADRAIDEDRLREALDQLGVGLVGDSANGPDAIPTKAATLNPEMVEAGMRRFLDQHATRRAASMSEWTRVRVRNLVSRGLEDGKAAAEIADDVSRWLRDPARAKTVAITEVTAARNASADFAAQNDPRPMWKTWITTTDGHQRETHGAASGQRVLDFEAFNIGGYAMRFPGDPAGPAGETINCRCRLQFNLARGTAPGTAQGF